jgi:UDP-N-acetylmuramoyl-L-alanyl-D-glutamate--2,6-diaminopimelate ligase
MTNSKPSYRKNCFQFILTKRQLLHNLVTVATIGLIAALQALDACWGGKWTTLPSQAHRNSHVTQVAWRPQMSTSLPNPGTPAPQPSRVINLREFLAEAVFVGDKEILVRRCCNQADRCQRGDVFVPDHNASVDQADRIEEAVRRGAVAVITERLLPVTIPQCLVEDSRAVYAQLCQALAGEPSQRMLTVGVVGSHGKTTTALFIASMLKRMAGGVAYYTSLGSSDSTECDRTTTQPPAAAKLARWMERSDKAGSPAVIIELTPAMLHQQTISGIEFDLIVVTSMRSGQFRGSPNSEQIESLVKGCLQQLKPHGVLVVNADDANAASFADKVSNPTILYGLDAGQHIRGKRLSRDGGQQQVLSIAGNTMMPLTLKMPGDHIARAALAALAVGWITELPVPQVIAGIESLECVPGRMQRLQQAVEVPVFIDHGQTPDRAAVALHALRVHHFGPCTVVMDLSNQLDSVWRQRLGEVLEKGAHRVVLSSSDLSPEATQRLAMDVLGGCKSPGRIEVIPDREAAIAWAIRHTQDGCVLLSGCGASTWTTRSACDTSDEIVAKRYIAEKNSDVSIKSLTIFPPNSSTEFFSH